MRHRHFISVAVVLGSLISAAAAYASTGTDNLHKVSIGTDDAFEFASTKPPASFMDTVKFDLNSSNAVVTSAFSVEGVKDLGVSLFNDTTLHFVYQCTSGCVSTDTFSGLTKGDKYSLFFTGSTIGPKDSTSSISGTLSVSAVPEPATWISCLTGLGLLAFYARRRRARHLPELASRPAAAHSMA